MINNSVMNDIVLINTKRTFYLSIVTMFINVATIVLFSMNSLPFEENKIRWHMGIILSHSILFVIMLILGCLSYRLKKREKTNLLMQVIQILAIISIQIFGVIVVTIDQIVTSNITPFVITCIITGVVFLLRPFWAIIVYSGAFISFYLAIGLTQLDMEILLSNRVNGIAMIGIGICTSLIAWKTNVSNILQKRFIDNQQKELSKKNSELEHMAFYDPLTSLYNRRRFEEMIKKEIAMISRYEHESCIVIADIDDFKQVNDNYGHPVGDIVIKEVASKLKQNIRETDVISRWGGEEFLIMLINLSLSDAIVIAEKLRKAIEETILHVEDKEIHVTASFGVAKLGGNESDALELTYKEADEALYIAKEGGRNRVVSADDEEGLPVVSVHFEWKSKWESGNKNIDEQHKEILESGNRLVYMSLSGMEFEKVLYQLDILLRDVIQHFDYEEHMLLDIGYPDYERHCKLHQDLTQKALLLKNSYQNGELKVTAFFSFIVEELILGHMLEEDILFFPYTTNKDTA